MPSGNERAEADRDHQGATVIVAVGCGNQSSHDHPPAPVARPQPSIFNAAGIVSPCGRIEHRCEPWSVGARGSARLCPKGSTPRSIAMVSGSGSSRITNKGGPKTLLLSRHSFAHTLLDPRA